MQRQESFITLKVNSPSDMQSDGASQIVSGEKASSDLCAFPLCYGPT